MRRMPGLAPIMARNLGAKGKQTAKITAEAAIPRMMDCTAAWAAPSGSFSPVRRATTAVVPMLIPTATAKIMVSMPSVIPTVAVESAPRCATQNMSTMPKSDSMAISSTMGTASRKMARSMDIAVKSFFDPKMASLTRVNQFSGFCSKGAGTTGSGEAVTGELKAFSPFRQKGEGAKSVPAKGDSVTTGELNGDAHRKLLSEKPIVAAEQGKCKQKL